MEDNGETRATSSCRIRIVGISAFLDHKLVRLILFALIEDAVRLRRIEHDWVPCFTSRAAKKSKESGAEVLEVHMVIHLACIIDINQGELADANNGEHENQEQE